MTEKHPSHESEAVGVDPNDDPIRPHVFDGIAEYDKRMPNWWLFTLYLMIAFSVVYWVVCHEWKLTDPPEVALQAEMKANQLAAAKNSGAITDEVLLTMSHDAGVVNAGKATYAATCASCHMPDMSGGIGPNLKDATWIHGGKPMDIVKTITDGVLAKGMPTWGAVLGKQKITEVTAFILSQQQGGAPAATSADPVKLSQAESGAPAQP